MDKPYKEAISVSSGSLAVFPSEVRLAQSQSNVGSPLRFELSPTVHNDLTDLDIHLIVLPFDFVRPNGTQTGFSVGCLEANFRFTAVNGKLRLPELQSPEIEFTGTTETSTTRGAELRPKIELKGGKEKGGVGGEAGSLSRSSLKRLESTAKASTDEPRVRCLRFNGNAGAQWTIIPSPVLPDPPPLYYSRTLRGYAEWEGDRIGEVQIWGRRHVFCDGEVKLSGANRLRAKFIHWVRSLKVYDDRRAERFKIVEAA